MNGHEIIWAQPPAFAGGAAARLLPVPREALQRPAILRFNSDSFMPEFLNLLDTNPEQLRELSGPARNLAWLHAHAGPRSAENAVAGAAAPGDSPSKRIPRDDRRGAGHTRDRARQHAAQAVSARSSAALPGGLLPCLQGARPARPGPGAGSRRADGVRDSTASAACNGAGGMRSRAGTSMRGSPASTASRGGTSASIRWWWSTTRRGFRCSRCSLPKANGAGGACWPA